MGREGPAGTVDADAPAGGAWLTGLTLSAATGLAPFAVAPLLFMFRYLRIVGENGVVNLRRIPNVRRRSYEKNQNTYVSTRSGHISLYFSKTFRLT